MTKLQEIQTILGFEENLVDDKWGPLSQEALDTEIAASRVRHAPKLDPIQLSGEVPADERSERAIATLLRPVQTLARSLVHAATAAGITIVITSGTRTYEEQNALFNQGGVTKARGGYSNHNFGLAFDVTIFDGNKPVWDSPDYAHIGKLGKALGLSWGGDWQSFQDEPHFELRPKWAENLSESNMLAELRRRKEVGQSPLV
jgi:peptidoglycan L-alanyl-D-glutamate endopeptidase CwlK